MPNTPAPEMDTRGRFAYLGCLAILTAGIGLTLWFRIR